MTVTELLSTVIPSVIGGGAVSSFLTIWVNYLLKKGEMGISRENTYLQNLEKRLKEQDTKIEECENDRKELHNEVDSLKETINRLERKQSVAIVVCNSKGYIVEWSAGATMLFYYTRDEVIGKLVSILMPNKYRQRFFEAINSLPARGGQPNQNPMKFTAINRNNDEMRVMISLSSYQTRENWYYTAEVRLIDSHGSDSEIINQKELFKE